MKIALTGANGFLGSYIAKAYLNEGYDVIALVRASANLSNLPSASKLHLENVNYREDLDAQFKYIKEKHGEIDLFVHNAGVTVSLDNQEYFDINTTLTGSIVKSVEDVKWIKEDGKVVYVSSLTAQGPAGIDKPVSKYGESKLKAENFFRESGYDHLIIRPTAIYGAGDYAFLPLLKGAKGKMYPVTNKHQKMSMIHAKDLAKMIMTESKSSTGTYHATDGVTYTHADFVDTLSRILNRKIYKIPVPGGLSKFILGLSDVWHGLIKKRPSITKEKYQEISMDWDLHENQELTFSKVPCEVSLEEGFRDAYEFYKKEKLL